MMAIALQPRDISQWNWPDFCTGQSHMKHSGIGTTTKFSSSSESEVTEMVPEITLRFSSSESLSYSAFLCLVSVFSLSTDVLVSSFNLSHTLSIPIKEFTSVEHASWLGSYIFLKSTGWSTLAFDNSLSSLGFLSQTDSEKYEGKKNYASHVHLLVVNKITKHTKSPLIHQIRLQGEGIKVNDICLKTTVIHCASHFLT